jgi:hypothetical protein
VSSHGKQAFYGCNHCDSDDKMSYKILDSVLWFCAKKFEAQTILNTKQDDIQQYRNLIVERQSQIEKASLSFDSYKTKTCKNWAKQFPHWSIMDLEREFNNNPKSKDTKIEFENLAMQWKRDIENYKTIIEDLEGNLKLKKDKFAVQVVKDHEDAVKEAVELGKSGKVATETVHFRRLNVKDTNVVNWLFNTKQIENITKELDMYSDLRKRDIISKYIKEVRIKTFTDINTPTLQIDIYYNLSDKPLSIYYSYRQMNENKRLFRFI